MHTIKFLLKNSDQFTVLYQSRYDLLNARVQAQQKQIAAIQEAINQKNLAKTQTKLSKRNNKAKMLSKIR